MPHENKAKEKCNPDSSMYENIFAFRISFPAYPIKIC